MTDPKRADALAEADRRKNDFLAMLAHELRNPLAPILNAAEVLRLREPDDPALQRARAVVERQARHMARQSPARSARILIVEDNLDAADTLAELLTLLGHNVRVAHDGPTALEVAVRFQPEVVLLDLGLPVMNGYEVAHKLRQFPSLNGVQLVAVTGYGQDEDRRRSQEAGFHHHLVKPVDIAAVEGLLAIGA
jgi:CheY-like chemotaxis protein